MNRWAERVLIFGLGALVAPVVEVVAAKYAGRHWLGIEKENR